MSKNTNRNDCNQPLDSFRLKDKWAKNSRTGSNWACGVETYKLNCDGGWTDGGLKNHGYTSACLGSWYQRKCLKKLTDRELFDKYNKELNSLKKPPISEAVYKLRCCSGEIPESKCAEGFCKNSNKCVDFMRNNCGVNEIANVDECYNFAKDSKNHGIMDTAVYNFCKHRALPEDPLCNCINSPVCEDDSNLPCCPNPLDPKCVGSSIAYKTRDFIKPCPLNIIDCRQVISFENGANVLDSDIIQNCQQEIDATANTTNTENPGNTENTGTTNTGNTGTTNTGNTGNTETTPEQDKTNNMNLIIIGIIGFVLLIIILGIVLALNNSDDGYDQNMMYMMNQNLQPNTVLPPI